MSGIPPFGSPPFKIKQLNADPASPRAEQTWVRRTASSGGGGQLKYIFGLGFPVTTVGVTTYSYQLSYRTKEGTTKRATLS